MTTGHNVDAVLLDLTRDPPPPGRFGLVASLLALHHVPDVDGILRAFHSTLEPGGILCISDLDLEDGSFHGPGVDVHPSRSTPPLPLRSTCPA